jgi:type IV secretory pathway TraG/TraD family ATPase VirD4
MWKVTEWALGSAQQAEEILASHGATQWAAELGELRGEALRTAATIRMVLSRALALMNDPVLATAVMPSEGTGFDPEAFLRSRSTLYMIASTEQAESPLAPLFAMLAAEIHYTAIQIGSHMDGGRMDPPLLMALDEVTQICPVPLPVWLSDSGGKGIQIISIVHGEGQLKERWKEHGAQIVMDTSGCKVFLPGITDTNTLEMASKISGKASYREEGEDKDSRHEKLTPDMIRQLPPSFALIVRGGYAPVIGRLPKAWRDRLYRKAKRHGQAIAPLVPVEGLEAAQEAQVVLMPERPAAAVAARQLALVPDIEADCEGEPLETPPATYPWSPSHD